MHVSVVVTAYNHGRYITEALRSVLDQTRAPDDVLVVDDGSTDDTADRVAEFRGRVAYHRQENRGVAASRNAGVGRARGDLLVFLDGDDVWAPEKLEVQVGAAEAYPESGLIVVDGVRFDGDRVLVPTLLQHAPPSTFGAGGNPVTTSHCYEALLRGNFIGTISQVATPASVLEAVGPSDTRLPVSSDYDLYLRIAERYPITVVRRSLVKCRYLETSASGPADLRPLRWGADVVEILKKHRRAAPRRYRMLIGNLLGWKIGALAAEAYRYGRLSDRSFASRYLAGLLSRNPKHVSIALWLAILWSPPAVAARAEDALRRLTGHA